METPSVDAARARRTLARFTAAGAIGRVHVAGSGQPPGSAPRMVLPTPTHAFVICLSGRLPLGFAVGGTWARHELEPGDVLYRPAHTALSLYLDSPYESVGGVFSPAGMRFHVSACPGDAQQPRLAKSAYLTRTPGPRAASEPICQALASLDDPPHDDLASDLVRLLLRMLSERITDAPTTPQSKGQHTFEVVCNFIAEHADEPLDRQSVATALNLSPSHISRLFTQFSDQPFAAFLRHERLRHARTLLADPTLSISAIAERVGFTSANYFVRTFRNAYGIPPGAYRAQEQ